MHGGDAIPVGSAPIPALRKALFGLFVHGVTLCQDRRLLALMPLSRGHKPETTVTVFVVIPVHECLKIITGIFDGAEVSGIHRRIFHSME